MKETVEFDIVYPHPPERVWQALTEAKALTSWLMPTDFQPLIGFRFRLDRPSGSRIEAKVTDVELNSLLAYTWRDDEDGQASIVIWSLEPEDGGTRVHLQHLPLEEPVVTCLSFDNYYNWRYALRYRLPGLLQILAGQAQMPLPMVVYAGAGK